MRAQNQSNHETVSTVIKGQSDTKRQIKSDEGEDEIDARYASLKQITTRTG